MRRRHSAFTFMETMVVLAIVALLATFVCVNVMSLLKKYTFQGQVQDFVSTMQMAASAAAQSNRRYEVIIDLIEQSYTLREITSPDLTQVLDEEIITQKNFNENCQVVYVLFDDLVETDEEHQVAKFRAGHAGWQNGGKIVLFDKYEQPYTVLVNRISRIVTLEKGNINLPMPKREDEMPF